VEPVVKKRNGAVTKPAPDRAPREGDQ